MKKRKEGREGARDARLFCVLNLRHGATKNIGDYLF
jgi:hypothetical protein